MAEAAGHAVLATERVRPDGSAIRPATVRPKTSSYKTAIGPRAFAVTTSGAWLWRPGATPLQAIDKTMADCAAQSKTAPCILYAVNNRVVFGAR
jgi:hypothetical protein